MSEPASFTIEELDEPVIGFRPSVAGISPAMELVPPSSLKPMQFTVKDAGYEAVSASPSGQPGRNKAPSEPDAPVSTGAPSASGPGE